MNHSSTLTQPQIERIISGCDQMNIDLASEQLQKLNQFLANLVKWNQAYNLTAIRNIDEMVIKHILDSLVILPFISGNTFLDVGTGPGLPGIPLAICDKTKHWTLIDSNGKKTRFLLQMKTELNLSNISVIKGRIEACDPEIQYDMIISRAFSSLKNFVDQCLPLLKPGGELLALKGLIPTEEMTLLDQTGFQIDVEPLQVPFLPDARNLVRVKPNKNG